MTQLMLEIKLFIDGGIRKGCMALGFVAYDMNNNEIFSGNSTCGKNGTSNLSEYRALITGLATSLTNGVNIIHVYSDSQLVVKQITGAFRAKKMELIEHRDRVLELLEQFDYYTIKWVPRHENKRADTLVNEVFERKSGKCSKKRQKR